MTYCGTSIILKIKKTQICKWEQIKFLLINTCGMNP